MELLGAALRAVSLARGAARMTGHPVQGLDELNEVLAPIRARRRIEQIRQATQPSTGTGSPNQVQSTDADDDDGVPDVDPSGPVNASDATDAADAADTGGILDLFGDAVDWIKDLF